MVRKAISNLFAFAALAMSASGATITTYTDKTTFESALSSFSTITFDATASLGAEVDFSTAAGFSQAGVRFVGVNKTGFFLTVANATVPQLAWGTAAVLRMPYYWGIDSYTTVTLAQPVTAVAFNAMTASPLGGTFIITFPAEFNIAPLTFSTSAVLGRPSWKGFTSDIPFSSFQIQTQANAMGLIDNFEFGNINAQPEEPAETPEIATLLMLGSGLLFIRFGSRRMRSLAH